jgi:serine/threonine-protein kinase HipA
LKGGSVTFQYLEEWLNWENAIPISQSMPLQNKAYSGDVVSRYFENLLPDSENILRKIAEKTGAEGRDAYSLLAKIGRDCVGALQFLPYDMKIDPLQPPCGRVMEKSQIATLLADLERAPLGIETDGGFRISLAGAQEKAAFLRIGSGWYEPDGLSPTTHIFKPAIGAVHWESGSVDMTKSVENEFYCLKLMKAFGLDIAHVEIESFGDKTVLIVERFDRFKTDEGVIIRLPQEDMCQALSYPPSQKYQSTGGPRLIDILKFLAASETPEQDQRDIYKSQILFWMIGAIDGHAKNFSIFLTPNDGFRLTPIYDVISAQPAFDAKQIRHKDYRLAMSVGRKPHYRIDSIHGRHFVESAIAADLSAGFAREVVREIQSRFETAFDTVLGDIPENFPLEIHDSIRAGAESRLPLLQSAFED